MLCVMFCLKAAQKGGDKFFLEKDNLIVDNGFYLTLWDEIKVNLLVCNYFCQKSVFLNISWRSPSLGHQ